MTTKFLDNSNFPEDLQTLSNSDLETLAVEIRERLIDVCDHCGGHLASNLGVVELTLVLHILFESPNDKFFWDTSHQTYVHKMLTGRLDKMYTIRQDNGLSGFANIFESDHDAFGAGHASTSISAALGAVHARDLQKQDHKVVAVFGDSALSGGMAFEALNNVEGLDKNFICVLNDNDMSISRPVGSMAQYITHIRTTKLYDKAKSRVEKIINRVPKYAGPLKRRVEKIVDHLIDIIVDTKAGVIFEEFGFKYLGPIDGHNIPLLMAALKYAKTYNGPIMIHIITQKGKGLKVAEADPIKYHGVSPTPSPSKIKSTSDNPKVKTFSQTLGDKMTSICNKNKKVVVITPAMKEGSGLSKFSDAHPDRFFDVGIAEEHAVTYAAGLARNGIKPLLAIYSTFLQRGYDQVIHDVCIQNLPVVFALDRAGIAGQDGPTHQGVFDYAFLLSIPNMTILAPKDPEELERMLDWSFEQNSPISIRYPKSHSSDQNGDVATEIGAIKSECLTDNRTDKKEDIHLLYIGVGTMAWPCYDAALVQQSQGKSVVAINLRFIKPLDTKFLAPYIEKAQKIIVVEEGAGIGGVYHNILREFNHLDKALNQWKQIALPDQFIEHGQVSTLKLKYGLTASNIITQTESWSKISTSI
ncbi:1-deoxy-D-xylulose-5-phosphate synthase [Candidatus Marinamargulisbacteria bacterium SCGC AAA071-K20]|nr:1-deoxy-D-xylulose-5-phosphate synthase [Candidatus Marinamargulisbacteria bacterium SCGC AAA071-K20]